MELPELNDLSGDIGALGIVVIATLIGLAVHWASWWALAHISIRTPSIADELYLATHTVDTHVRGIYDKLQVNSAVSAVVTAIREGIIKI